MPTRRRNDDNGNEDYKNRRTFTIKELIMIVAFITGGGLGFLGNEATDETKQCLDKVESSVAKQETELQSLKTHLNEYIKSQEALNGQKDQALREDLSEIKSSIVELRNAVRGLESYLRNGKGN